MLSRVYGTSFFTREELEEHLRWMEEAKKRDHRKLGRELEIFDIYPDLGPGLAVYHPKGSIIREVIENFEKEEHIKRGYQLVRTPHISKADLWKVSGRGRCPDILTFTGKICMFFPLMVRIMFSNP